MKKLLTALVALVLSLALPLSSAWAASKDLDEIIDYQVKVDVNEDATLTMKYHIEWKVLDSTTDGPLTWVLIGIPNKHYVSMEGKSPAVKSIKYRASDGSHVRIDLDRAYEAGEVAVIDFELVQDYMYQVGRDNQGEAVYEFTPGWFDDIVVDKLEVKWNSDKVDRIAPAAQNIKGYYTWTTSLKKGERFTVTVGYPDTAFAFNVDKTIEKGNGKSAVSDSDGEDDWFTLLAAFGVLAFMIWVAIAVLKGLANAVLAIYESATGFKAGKKTAKKITRTKVVYYPVCQGCGAARPEGKDTCAYCGRSFIKSEEVIEEKDIPAEEKAIKGKKTNGEYAYSSEPNTFLRVNVVSVPVTTRSHSRSRGGGSCACASSCACACGCACACACAGGGRAGCTTKDFYKTDLKLRQLEADNRK